MATLDNIVALLQKTLFHPLASITLPAGVILSETDFLAQLFRNGLPSALPSIAVTGRLRAALYCVGFSWVLFAHRVLRKRALNPSPKMTVQWPKEVVLVTGGSSGVGGELVRRLESYGAAVAIMDIQPPNYKLGMLCNTSSCATRFN